MQWHPTAYVGLHDAGLRRALSDALGGEGWRVVATPTGFHLVESMADILLGRHAGLEPALVVADARSPGCSGTTIAQGIRDLGWPTPVVLVVASPDDHRLLGDIDAVDLHVVDADRAIRGVLEIARASRGGRRDDVRVTPLARVGNAERRPDRQVSN